MKTSPGTFFQNSIIWIDRVEKHAKIKDGFHMSPVYQLQPFDLALKVPSKLVSDMYVI